MWNALAISDIRSKYRLSTLGTMWITLTTGSLAVAIGLIYGQFFGIDVTNYLPYFVCSFIVWTFIASVIGEAAHTLIGSGNMIKSSQMPILFHVLRMLQRNFITLLHNLVVVVGVWAFFRWPVGLHTLLALPGLAVCYVFLIGLGLILSIICVRYRDVPPLIQVMTQFLFFASPVMWQPEQIKFGTIVLHLNPVAYMLTIVRNPLLGRPTEALDWGIAIAIALFTLAIGMAMYVRYRHRIAYWV